MISSDNLCMSCMREIGDEKICPYCGYHVDSAQISPYLPVRTLVANRYLVGKMLEYNGEGATYIGWDLKEKKAVKLREFIPDSFTTRTTTNLNLQVMPGSEATFAELRRSFEELWTKLARLKGLSALISVNAVVEDYNTSYAIYDHFEGISLRDFLLRNKLGYVPWEKARQLLMPLLSTLGTLHSAGIIHRGISPSTLIIGGDGKIKITGFCIGAARTARSELNSQLFDGYAAIEQYGLDGRQGTWTDIYAFAAVLYRTLIGSDPISAKERMTNDRLMVPGKFAEALPAYVSSKNIDLVERHGIFNETEFRARYFIFLQFVKFCATLWMVLPVKTVGGWPLCFLFGGDTSFTPNRYREGVLFMVTWEGIFAFCMVIIAVISLARQDRD